MKRLFFVLAFVFAIPAIVLLANMTMYAFTGSVFLVEGNEEVTAARAFVSWLTVSLSIVSIGIGANK